MAASPRTICSLSARALRKILGSIYASGCARLRRFIVMIVALPVTCLREALRIVSSTATPTIAFGSHWYRVKATRKNSNTPSRCHCDDKPVMWSMRSSTPHPASNARPNLHLHWSHRALPVDVVALLRARAAQNSARSVCSRSPASRLGAIP